MRTYSIRDAIPESAEKKLAEYPALLQKLLFYRGIKTQEEAHAFLYPDYEAGIHDPFLLKDMERAVARILEAIDNQETIVIYSDYDCDGIPGGVLLHDFFKKINYAHFSNYIPHRHEEGYGLNISAIEKAADDGATLLITVDCGITDAVPVETANERHIDVIITDHHLPHDPLPDAFAIINPKQDSCKYPFDGLCGAGVAFKLTQGLIARGNFDIHEGWEKWLLDMAGLSTIADMMPLSGENRVLAHYGLKVLRKSRRPGLQQLCKKMRVNQRYLSEDDIGFMVAPRINAASRMDHPEDAFFCLASDDVLEAGKRADYLHELNDKRKGIVAAITKEINKRIGTLGEMKSVFVMGNPKWKPSLLGLAANSIVEKYNTPVFLWGRDGGNTIKGSCRAPSGINVVELMGALPDFFIDFGGHVSSGGFSVTEDRVHELEGALTEALLKHGGRGEKQEHVIDARLFLSDVSWETYRSIEQCAPFGIGNPKPLFLFKELLVATCAQFGKEGAHLKLTFLKESGAQVEAIGFFMTSEQFGRPIAAGTTIDLVATLEKSTFRNRPELRLRIVDIL